MNVQPTDMKIPEWAQILYTSGIKRGNSEVLRNFGRQLDAVVKKYHKRMDDMAENKKDEEAQVVDVVDIANPVAELLDALDNMVQQMHSATDATMDAANHIFMRSESLKNASEISDHKATADTLRLIVNLFG